MSAVTPGTMKLAGVTWSSLGGQQHNGAGSLQPGQVYRARVEKVEPDGAVVLRLGSHTVRMVTELGLVRGQELLLRMTTAGAQPNFSILRVMPTPQQVSQVAVNPGSAGPSNLASQIQSLFGKQQPVAALLQFLQLPAENAALAPLLAVHWDLLRKQFSQPQDLVDPARLRKMIEGSGLLLESRLAQPDATAAAPHNAMPAMLTDDLKMALWRALGAPLPDTPDLPADALKLSEGLWRLLEGVSAQISLRQIHSITQAELGHFNWTIELPLQVGERAIALAVTIARDHALAGEEQAAADSWRVELALDLEPLGPLKVSLFVGEQRVSVALEAERPDSVKVLAANLAQLEQTLQGQGFTVDALLSRPMAAAISTPELTDFKHILAVTA